jgi:signal transduction histidine kinase
MPGDVPELTHDSRVLILAPAGKDAPMARDVLANHGVAAFVCPTLDALCDEWPRGAGLLLVAEEALFPNGLDQLSACLAAQPAWSDIPVLVFLAGAATTPSIERLRTLPNVAVLERPIRIPAFVSTVNAALRGRSRQYQVRDLMAELRAANRAKDDFLAMVSHELRAPLNVIRGVSQLLLQQHADLEGVSAAAAKIDRNAATLSRLVEDLLDLSRLQKRRFQLNVGPVDIVNVLNAAVDMNRLAAEAKGVRIASDLDATPVQMLGDTLRLEQVVSNLVSNAIKFTPAGGVVTLRLSSVSTEVQIVVTDTGEGIAPEFLPHVFEPFRQGDSRARGQGLGVGLAIVRQFVELHGGSIVADSDGAGRGAKFTVRLPLHPDVTSVLTA